MNFLDRDPSQRASNTRLSLNDIFVERPGDLPLFDGAERFEAAAPALLATRSRTPSGRFEGVLVDLGPGVLGIITPGTLAEAVLAAPSLTGQTLAQLAQPLVRVRPDDPIPFDLHNFVVVEGDEVVALARNPVYVVLTNSGRKGTHVCG